MKQFMTALAQFNLKREAGPQFFKRGKALYEEGAIKLISLDSEHAHLQVEGNYVPYYGVDYVVTGYRDASLYYECECEAYFENGICKHVVAAGLYLKDIVKVNVDPEVAKIQSRTQWREQVEQALNKAYFQYSPKSRTKSGTPFLIFFSLQSHYYRDHHKLYAYKLRADQLPDTLYAKKAKRLIGQPEAIRAELVNIEVRKNILDKVGFKTKLDPEACLNLSPQLVTMLQMGQIGHSQSNYYSSYYSTEFEMSNFVQQIASFGGEIFLGSQDDPFEAYVDVKGETPIPTLNLKQSAGTLQVTPELVFENKRQPIPSDAEYIELAETTWIKADNQLIRVGATNDIRLDLIKEIGQIELEAEESAFFLDNYLLPLVEIIDISGNAVIWHDVRGVMPKKQIYLHEDDTQKQLLAQLAFSYDGNIIPYIPSDPTYGTPPAIVRDEERPFEEGIHFSRIHRSIEYELETYSGISGKRYGLKRGSNFYKETPSIFELRARTSPIDFLMRNIPNLTEDGFEIYGEELLKSLKVLCCRHMRRPAGPTAVFECQ
ncbi:MAG: hypothetical protein AAF633_20385, partial [Chloroflexota bacterium]